MIESVRIKNFKAIRDSGKLRPKDFCVFIGNNGSGKSSILEALRTLQDAFVRDIETAMNVWGGMEQIRHHSAALPETETTQSGFKRRFKPIEISLVCKLENERYEYDIHFNTTENGDKYVIEYESLRVGKVEYYSVQAINPNGWGKVNYIPGHNAGDGVVVLAENGATDYVTQPLSGLKMLFRPVQLLNFGVFIYKWQFISLNVHAMGLPTPQSRTKEAVHLDWQGLSLAEVIRELSDQPEFLNVIVEKMKFVLPYVSDIRSKVKSEFQRSVELEMKEEKSAVPVPGWLFSSGTLRILALLTIFNHPTPPSLVMIDEIENGIDPRTIGLLLEEIRAYLSEQGRQVLATTHSPYLLDLLEYRHIVVAEKEKGEAQFHRVDGDDSLNVWKEKFTPGKLYTMGKLNS